MEQITDYKAAVKPNKVFIFLSPAQNTVVHGHTFYELAYVLSGKCEHTMNGKTYVMTKGDYILLDKNCIHSYTSVGDEELSIVNCLFFPSFIDSSISNDADIYTLLTNYHFKFKKELFIQNPIGSIFKDTNGETEALLTIMNNEFINKDAGFLELIRSCLIQLLITTLRGIYSDVKNLSDDSTVQNVIEYIGQNYMKDITLKEICNIFNYSLPYMSAKFKKSVGIPFVEHLQKTRIENSMKLLSETDQPVADIAYIVGYRDIKSYYRAFKKHTDTTPAEFRKKSKKIHTEQIYIRYEKISENLTCDYFLITKEDAKTQKWFLHPLVFY